MKKKVKLVLLKNIPKLGKCNDVVNVAAGYARNYLLPNNLAILYDNSGKNYVNQKLNAKEKILAKINKSNDKIINSLLNNVLTFERKVSKKGTLYGSVTVLDIINEIKKITGIKILEDMIVLNENVHIKKPGEYTYTLILSPDIKYDFKLKIEGVLK